MRASPKNPPSFVLICAPHGTVLSQACVINLYLHTSHIISHPVRGRYNFLIAYDIYTAGKVDGKAAFAFRAK